MADRAKLLGHSISTNLNYYSFHQKDYVENARNILNGNSEDDAVPDPFMVKGTFSGQKGTFSVMEFDNRKARKC